MAELFQFVLCVWGLCYLVTTSVLCRPIRRLISRLGPLARTLIYCRACTGFWVALCLALLGHYPKLPVIFYGPLDGALVGLGAMAVLSELVPNYAWEVEASAPATGTGGV